jgi:hypothetical protein
LTDVSSLIDKYFTVFGEIAVYTVLESVSNWNRALLLAAECSRCTSLRVTNKKLR